MPITHIKQKIHKIADIPQHTVANMFSPGSTKEMFCCQVFSAKIPPEMILKIQTLKSRKEGLEKL